MKKVFMAAVAGVFLVPFFVLAADIGDNGQIIPTPMPTSPPATTHNTQTTGANTASTQTTGTNTGSGVGLFNPLGANSTLPVLLSAILALVVRIGTFVVIFMLVYVGYLFVIARGAPGKIEEARRALLWTVVGALILLGAQALAIGIQATVQSIGNAGASPGAGIAPQPNGAAGSINIY